MQKSWRQRLREITPYKDIVDQVEQHCLGKGGFRRMRKKMGRLERPLRGGKKAQRKTELDNKANSLATSRCDRFAKARLDRFDEWPEPEVRYPEVAFIGRSNVGKSSLLNTISKFGSIAAVSTMPGRTKHVSWYRNRKVGVDILDMPGYGHSERAQTFGPAALQFIKNRTSLHALYVLIDARHGFKRSDHEWLSQLGRDGPMKQIILTKCDMVPENMLVKIASLARSDLEAYKRFEQRILLCSTVWKFGLHEIRMDMCRRCGLCEPRRAPDDEGFSLLGPAGSQLPPGGSPPPQIGDIRRPAWEARQAAVQRAEEIRQQRGSIDAR